PAAHPNSGRRGDPAAAGRNADRAGSEHACQRGCDQSRVRVPDAGDGVRALQRHLQNPANRLMRRLLIRPGAIGDLIVSLPALECLRAEYLEVWAPERNLPLIRFADRVRSISATGLDLLGLPGIAPPKPLIETLRSFGSIISWYGAARPEFRSAVELLGLPFQFFPALPCDARCHAIDFYLAQVGSACSTLAPRVHCPGERANFCVIHPFASGPGKRWPLNKFREVA